ncbi:TPA: DUF551 domain-containing protein [Klebsiella pneumoniae]|uniref:DUF551 domain-containing protein n=2 Tax=Klebsiella pneumoniae TaxID=573 RepID=UPI0014384100|nr:DUF551 domain-containing protein [Klebsiella pneumoniae]MCW9375194.1 DUF551 domain-containing protein [Klebsiella pneumoniae]NKE99980.1 DUF551 domain-containing protein [Klebsiella pneumoniae]HCT2320693.1 DUF551 domain-containing protein [Klebsiella pneumoniae]HCU1083081.1 DUF551 domain-containing protein [Klebsiella pneumoniae]HCU1163966.1 DUF551 domain-containing protein [Klebsiella pneumoniae]
MSEFSRETLLNIIETDHVQCGEASALARMALAAMDSSESVELPLDYLQGHKDGLEWAAQLAEANHPETGDWLYDDPIELSKAIRKGPDMPPVQPVADSEPVIVVGDDGGDALSYRRLIQSFEPGTKLYRHAQPALVIPDEMTSEQAYEIGYYYGDPVNVFARGANWMRQHIIDSTLAAAPQLPGSDPATVPGKWIPVSERMPEAEGHYLVWANASRIDGYCDHLAIATYQGGEWSNEFNWLVTHWMPLPAAPQEVKGES